jgi:hypothetical protein
MPIMKQLTTMLLIATAMLGAPSAHANHIVCEPGMPSMQGFIKAVRGDGINGTDDVLLHIFTLSCLPIVRG